MAKILPGAAVAKMSGTIAGTTYQNWRGILVARSKPTPTNVNTPRQSLIRSLMTTLSRAWRDELNQGLRTAWNQRAKNFPWLDVFGNSVSMTGENLYIKQNLVLLDHSLARVDTPVPDTMPPELDYITEDGDATNIHFDITQLPDAIVAAQTPFLDVKIAGGFLNIDDSGAPLEVLVDSQALPAGRKHQKSDFRHAFYLNNLGVASVDPQVMQFTAPLGHTRNMVVIVQGFNKYGNFTAPRLFEKVITLV